MAEPDFTKQLQPYQIDPSLDAHIREFSKEKLEPEVLYKEVREIFNANKEKQVEQIFQAGYDNYNNALTEKTGVNVRDMIVYNVQNYIITYELYQVTFRQALILIMMEAILKK